MLKRWLINILLQMVVALAPVAMADSNTPQEGSIRAEVLEALQSGQRLKGDSPDLDQPPPVAPFSAPVDRSIHEPLWLDKNDQELDWVPVVAIVMTFGAPVMIIWIVCRYRLRRLAIKQQCLQQVLAENREIPENLFSAIADSSQQQFRSGVRLIAVGTGLLLFLSLLTGFDIGSIGFIPLCLGIAKLIIWKVERTSTPL